MKVLKEKDLPLLKRKRLTAEIDHFKKPTPSKQEVLKTIAEKMKASEDSISLLHVYPHYGREKSKIIANVYKSKEDLETFEKIHKKKKKEKKKTAPAQEAPKEVAPKEKKEEAPKEEVKDGKEESKE
ncbi:MAG: hypothetical protein CMH62_01390 [Nanoarchaeota archaeon]|nr:hypothetical protein [Nanoarchaeota archaeon]|tara:strand:- start:1129 stop:1509 length:381 start_codon:yes stop_codon:yes gene_type:complete